MKHVPLSFTHKNEQKSNIDNRSHFGNRQSHGYIAYQKRVSCVWYGQKSSDQGQPFELLQMDVRNEESISKAVDALISKAGHIDILINNAGVGITGPMEELPIEELKNTFNTNLYGAVSLMQKVLPFMREQKSGLIINVTSIAGYMGLPFRGAYSASKGALILISEAFRMEVKSFGVEVTTVAPGDYATDIASRRFHSPVKKGSAYEKVYQKSLDLMNEHVDSGGDPKEMANRIFKIIQTKKPKVHYKQGSFLQKFSIVLKFLLPSKTYEKMLMNHYKL